MNPYFSSWKILTYAGKRFIMQRNLWKVRWFSPGALQPVPGSGDSAAAYGEQGSVNASHIVERNGLLTFRRMPVKFIKHVLLLGQAGVGAGGLGQKSVV